MMNEHRRSLMKSVLTGGTLLALGIPGITEAVVIRQSEPGKTRNCQLLLGNTAAGEGFSRGGYAACSAYTEYSQGIIPTVRLKDEMLVNPRGVAEFLDISPNTRWIAVMDDASAAIFLELVRESGGHLLAYGSHAFIPDGAESGMLRHVWRSASPAFSAGKMLASGLMESRHDFSIVENFLETPEIPGAVAALPVPDFSAWQLGGKQDVHLYCSGMNPVEACKWVGWEAEDGRKWVTRTAESSGAAGNQPDGPAVAEFPGFRDWVEATGYATVAMALGMGSQRDFCSSRAFVCGSGHSGTGNPALSGMHFVSLVIDV